MRHFSSLMSTSNNLVLFLVLLSCLSTTVLGKTLARPIPSHFSTYYGGAVDVDKSSEKSPKDTPIELFKHSVQSSLAWIQSTRDIAQNLTISHQKSPNKSSGLGGMIDCLELLDDTLDQMANVADCSKKSKLCDSDDALTWLSASLTNQETCLESLQSSKFIEKKTMDSMTKNLRQMISNSLELYTKIKPEEKGNKKRKLLHEYQSYFPRWLSTTERELLERSPEGIEASAVVSKEGGHGTHKTIGEAIKFLEAKAGKGRKVIYIKAGTYNENIKIPSKQKNVMLVGDGKGKTVIVGNRNVKDGWTTFQSATVAATGEGFIARDITFVNNAGPSKHQAVALRIGSDKSVVFLCSVVGYQDTLYAHSKRQFYRETDIYGTVDFIFGNSAVVFQKCNIHPRKPASSGQQNFITAQGRTSRYQNTGISIHDCKIAPASDLADAGAGSKIATFLGRPWKKHSRTVIMESFLHGFVNPKGWAPWSGDFALKTLYYGEYRNSGPGASTSGRVNWPTFHGNLTSLEAQTFTVGRFISGSVWLPSTGVSFDSGLLG